MGLGSWATPFHDSPVQLCHCMDTAAFTYRGVPEMMSQMEKKSKYSLNAFRGRLATYRNLVEDSSVVASNCHLVLVL